MFWNNPLVSILKKQNFQSNFAQNWQKLAKKRNKIVGTNSLKLNHDLNERIFGSQLKKISNKNRIFLKTGLHVGRGNTAQKIDSKKIF